MTWPKQKRRLCGAALLNTRLPEDNSGHSFSQACRHSVTRTEQMLREIQSLRVMQAPFGKVFWFLEQKIARLTDEIERTRT